MKKCIIALLIVLILGMSGCSLQSSETPATDVPVSYITKYVTNTEKLDMREQPTNMASIICSIDKNAPVSFVEDSENGYSKIVYNGVTGYAFSSYLTEEEPINEAATTENVSPSNNVVQSNPVEQSSENNRSASIISNRSSDEIENYIVSYVRPLYNEVNSHLNNYSTSTSNGVTYWHDGKGYIKKQFLPTVNNYGLTREYYYDTDSGRIAFAFIYSGNTEYRLYFRTNQLVRFISPNGNIVNNPDSGEALSMGEYVLSEAYR